jgi:hypothetical protein
MTRRHLRSPVRPELARASAFARSRRLPRGRPRLRARISACAAALHEELRDRRLPVAEDEEARDTAEAVAWYGDPSRIALLPSRGVRVGSRLEPPAHLVGERARALDVLAGGGFVCVSARALAEGMPPVHERPEAVRVTPGDEPGIDALVEALALAGYDRVERAEERPGSRCAVDYGRLPEHQARAASNRALRGRSSRSGVLALHPARFILSRGGDPAARERLHDPEELEEAAESPDDRVPLLEGAPDVVWQGDDVRQLWEEEGSNLNASTVRLGWSRSALAAACVRGAAPGDRRARLSEAENELAGMLRQGAVVVTFQHRGEAQRTQRLLRKVDAAVDDRIETLPSSASLRFAVSPARRDRLA